MALWNQPYDDQQTTGPVSRVAGKMPSLQSMAAADDLSNRYQQQATGAALSQMGQHQAPAPITAPTVLNSTNSWQARTDLQNAQTGASTMTADRNRNPKTGMSESEALYSSLLAQDSRARAAQPALWQSAMKENSDIQQAQLREQGANQRAMATNAISLAELGLGARKVANQEQATANDLLLGQQKLAAGPAAPSGYRVAANGSLEAIPGGPADKTNAPLNDVQSKALQFGSRMQESGKLLDSLASQGVTQPGYIKQAANAIGMGAAANWTQSPQQQQVEQAQRDFVNAVLRRESGAAISEGEFDNARRQYFPQPGDSPEVIAQKRANRDLAQRGIAAEVPNSDVRIGQVVNGAKPRTVTRSGTIDGRKVTQYSDGSIEYAD